MSILLCTYVPVTWNKDNIVNKKMMAISLMFLLYTFNGIISILRICILSWQCYGDCCQLPLILTLIIQNESSSPQFPYSIQIHWSLNGKNLKSSNIFKQIETMINCISKLWLTGHMCLALTGSMVKCDQVHVQIKLTIWSNGPDLKVQWYSFLKESEISS